MRHCLSPSFACPEVKDFLAARPHGRASRVVQQHLPQEDRQEAYHNIARILADGDGFQPLKAERPYLVVAMHDETERCPRVVFESDPGVDQRLAKKREFEG